jgi:lipoprotein NlpD
MQFICSSQLGRSAGMRLAVALMRALTCVALVGLLNGCGPSWSPVDKGSGGAREYRLTEDGRYRVQRGDSLYVIAFNFGLDWRDLARWNGIRSPYVIYPDQELRMSPPTPRESGQVVTRPAQTPGSSTSREGAVTPAAGESRAADPPDAAVSGAESSGRTTAPARSAPSPQSDPGRWLWPTDGRVISAFKANDPARNGIEIGGREGQSVIATAAGEVVYSGNGLIGYGELIIIKHSERMLSAYAHNKRRLVAEGQAVAAGERVAEMGRNDRNQALLHFEIRVNGTPQDPLRYLPKR